MTEADWLTATDPTPLFAFLRRRAWLAATNQTPMMEFFRSTASERRLRLLACAVIHSAPFAPDGQSMWDLAKTYSWFEQKARRYVTEASGEVIETQELVPMTCHQAVEIAERSADTPGMESDLAMAAEAMSAASYYAEAGVWDPTQPPGAEGRYRIAGCFEGTTTRYENLARGIFPERLDGWDLPISQDFLPTLASIVRDVFRNPFRPVAVDPAWLTSDVVALAGGVYAERAFDRLPILADALQDAGCDHAGVLDHCRSEGPHVRGCWVVDLLLGKT